MLTMKDARRKGHCLATDLIGSVRDDLCRIRDRLIELAQTKPGYLHVRLREAVQSDCNLELQMGIRKDTPKTAGIASVRSVTIGQWHSTMFMLQTVGAGKRGCRRRVDDEDRYDSRYSRHHKLDTSGRVSIRVLMSIITVMLIVIGAYFGLRLGGSQGLDAYHSCNNNMRKINRSLEAANYFTYKGTARTGLREGWRIAVLPFLDQAVLYESINAERAWNSIENSTCGRTVVTTFICPSSTPSRLPDDFARTSYLALGRARQDGIQDARSSTIPVLIDVALSDVAWLSADECREYQKRHLRNDLIARFSSGHSFLPGTYWALFADGSVGGLPQSELTTILDLSP